MKNKNMIARIFYLRGRTPKSGSPKNFRLQMETQMWLAFDAIAEDRGITRAELARELREDYLVNKKHEGSFVSFVRAFVAEVFYNEVWGKRGHGDQGAEQGGAASRWEKTERYRGTPAVWAD